MKKKRPIQYILQTVRLKEKNTGPPQKMQNKTFGKVQHLVMIKRQQYLAS